MLVVPIASSGIARQAMEYLELRPLSSQAEDSADARAMAEALPEGRRMCLEAGDFTVASQMRRLQIADLPDADLHPKFKAVYSLPSDMIVLRDVFADDMPADYVREGSYLRTHEAASVVARFTIDQDDETLLPPMLRQAVALQVAVLMCDLRSTSTAKKDMLIGQLRQTMEQARRFDRSGASPDRYDEWAGQGDWVSVATR